MIVTILLQALTLDVVIQGFFAALAMIFRTEKFYDLVGCLSFCLLAWMSLPSNPDSRSILITNVVIAARLYLGIYLFQRVMRRNGDRRFNKAKQSRSLMAVFWMGQAAWIFTTMLPVLIANGSRQQKPLNFTSLNDWIALSEIVLGLTIQVTSDLQKHRFQMNPANANKFIDTGLWKYSRHPNYFGEILSWVGIWMMATPVMPGMWKWISLLGPLFDAFLLTCVSGVPLLEKHAKNMWGNDPKYQEYVRNTPMLIPGLKIM